MFRIVMNSTVMDTCRSYSQALNKAKKIKKIFCKNDTFKVIIENEDGTILIGSNWMRFEVSKTDYQILVSVLNLLPLKKLIK